MRGVTTGADDTNGSFSLVFGIQTGQNSPDNSSRLIVDNNIVIPSLVYPPTYKYLVPSPSSILMTGLADFSLARQRHISRL